MDARWSEIASIFLGIYVYLSLQCIKEYFPEVVAPTVLQMLATLGSDGITPDDVEDVGQLDPVVTAPVDAHPAVPRGPGAPRPRPLGPRAAPPGAPQTAAGRSSAPSGSGDAAEPGAGAPPRPGEYLPITDPGFETPKNNFIAAVSVVVATVQKKVADGSLVADVTQLAEFLARSMAAITVTSKYPDRPGRAWVFKHPLFHPALVRFPKADFPPSTDALRALETPDWPPRHIMRVDAGIGAVRVLTLAYLLGKR